MTRRRGRHSRAPRGRRRWVVAALTVGVAGALVAGVAAAVATAPGAAGGPHRPDVLSTTAAPPPVRTTVPEPSTTTAPPPVTIAAVGDMELGNTPQLPPDPTGYLAPVEGALAAPIVFGNLEGTLTDTQASKCAPSSIACYAFRVPTSYAQVMRSAGFTVLNSANNHSHDYGAAGVASTSAALRAAGITQTGLPGQIGLVHEGATTIAFVGFAPYADVNDLLDLSAAKQLIAAAKQEADVVVVYMHAGAEGQGAAHVTGRTEHFYGENRGNPEAFAHAAIDDGADLVVASGPHVLRGMQFYRGHLIAYSLGDFACYRDFSTAGSLALSGILHVTMAPDGTFVSAQFTSLLLDAEGRPALDPTGAAARFVNGLSAADFGASAAVIGPSGALAPAAGS